jgi:hypothetical protein
VTHADWCTMTWDAATGSHPESGADQCAGPLVRVGGLDVWRVLDPSGDRVRVGALDLDAAQLDQLRALLP